jgi:cation diffusion facilitator CzcD-associated flavoprotein CzcO
MSARILEADYLVIGSGAAGMAFADTLVAETDAQVVMVDRRGAPGGHWNDAYPFVRLHQPSLYYGVNSTPLGSETLATSGPEAGMYERATGAEIRAYYERVMYQHLIPSGQAAA